MELTSEASKKMTIGNVRMGLKSWSGESLASSRSRISSRTILLFSPIRTLLIPLGWKTHQILSKQERGSEIKTDLDRVTIAEISANCLRHNCYLTATLLGAPLSFNSYAQVMVKGPNKQKCVIGYPPAKFL